MDSTEPQNNLDAVGSSETIVADDISNNPVEPEVPVAPEEPEQHVSEINNLPAIVGWKNAPGFSALGVIASFICMYAIAFLIPLNIYVPLLALLTILYAAIFYRSYFTEKPLVKSSRAISFLNFAFMGIVFGWCFNNNIRRSNEAGKPIRGTSYTVAIVLFVLFGAWSIYYYNFSFASHLYHNPRTGEYTLKSTAASGPSKSVPSESPNAKYSEVSVSNVIPDGWHQEALTKEREYLRWKIVPDDTSMVWAAYGTEESMRGVSNIKESDLRGAVSSNLGNCKDEKVEKVVLGSAEYWKITGSGTRQIQGYTVPISATMLMPTQDIGSIFVYYDCRDSPNAPPYYDDFEALVAKASDR